MSKQNKSVSNEELNNNIYNQSNIMKRYTNLAFTALFLIMTLVACQPAATEEVPTDLSGMKTYVQEKKAAIRSIEQEIAELEVKIEELEPVSEKTRKAVTTMVLESKPFKSYVELQGNIESSEAVMISSETGGRITSLTIDEGDYVRKGQVVGSVDMETMKRSLQEVQTSLDLATTVFERQKKLWDQNIGSEIQYLQAKNNKERLEKSLETMQSQLSKGTIIAPMSGYVDVLFLRSGEMSGPGVPIASVINTSTVKAVIDVPENLIGKVKRGDKVELLFPATGETRNAKVSMLGRSINTANRTFKAEINLSNSNSLLKPNLLVLAKFNDETIEDALALPTEYVQQDVSGTSYVYTVAEGEDGKYAKKNPVITGIGYDGSILIEEGLTNGDEVIVNGARSLAEEELIDIKNPQK